MTDDFKYFAFISYARQDNLSQRRDDGQQTPERIRWAEWLTVTLDAYRVPKSLTEKKNKWGEKVTDRTGPCFRDDADLPANAHLRASLEEALQQSRNLVVICSPRSSVSEYVNDEVMFFKKLGRGNRIFTLVVAGEPNPIAAREKPEANCYCAALRHPVSADGSLNESVAELPASANARWGEPPRELTASEKHRRRSVLENAKFQLIAGLLGVNLDDLLVRERRRKARARRIWTTVAGAVAVVILALAVAAWRQRGFALSQQAKAVAAQKEMAATLQYLQGEFRTALQSTADRKALNKLDEKVAAYLQGHPVGVLDWSSRAMAAALLQNRAELSRSEGKLDDAATLARKALVEREAIFQRFPNDAAARLELATALNSVAGIIWEDKTQEEEALSDYKRAKELAEPEENNDYDQGLALRVLLDASNGISFIEADRGHLKEATELAKRSVELAERRANQRPDDYAIMSGLGNALGRLFALQRSSGDLRGARDSAVRQVEVRRKIWEQTHMEMYYAPLAAATADAAQLLLQLGEQEAALQALHEADVAIRLALGSDPENVDWQLQAAQIWSTYAGALLILNKDMDLAKSLVSDALSATEKGLQKSPDAVLLKVQRAQASMMMTELLTQRQEPAIGERDHQTFEYWRELRSDLRLVPEVRENFAMAAVREVARLRNGTAKGNAQARQVVSEALTALESLPQEHMQSVPIRDLKKQLEVLASQLGSS